jgi:hypothetical protein
MAQTTVSPQETKYALEGSQSYGTMKMMMIIPWPRFRAWGDMKGMGVLVDFTQLDVDVHLKSPFVSNANL